MRIRVLHELKGRIRFSTDLGDLTAEQADQLQYYLLSLPGVRQAKVYDRSGNAVVQYEAERRALLRQIMAFSLDDPALEALVPEHTSPAAQPVLQGEAAGTCPAPRRSQYDLAATAARHQSGLEILPLSDVRPALPAPPQAGGAGSGRDGHRGLPSAPRF